MMGTVMLENCYVKLRKLGFSRLRAGASFSLGSKS